MIRCKNFGRLHARDASHPDIYHCDALKACTLVPTELLFGDGSGPIPCCSESCPKYDGPKSVEIFDRVVVINLERRPDRLEALRGEFAKGWPFVPPTIQKAIDGKLCKAPAGHTEGDFAWACFQSHRRAIEDALNDGCNSVLILEDDCVFADDFAARAVEFMHSIPADWEFAWLGGHHQATPITVGPGVVKSVKMDRTHAYAARGQGLLDLYRHWHQWHTGHCDWAISDWMRGRKSYCAEPWLIGQRGGYSDITWSNKPPEWWHANLPPVRTVQAVQSPAQNAAVIITDDEAVARRVKFNLEAYPCKFRGAFKRIENREGSCKIDQAPCFECLLPENQTHEASLWQFCTVQSMPFCNRCTERRLPDSNDGLVEIGLPTNGGQPVAAPNRQVRHSPHNSPFGGA